jgi:hypothetical protein
MHKRQVWSLKSNFSSSVLDPFLEMIRVDLADILVNEEPAICKAVVKNQARVVPFVPRFEKKRANTFFIPPPPSQECTCATAQRTHPQNTKH